MDTNPEADNGGLSGVSSTRRRFLTAAGGVLAFGASGLLDACGGSNATGSSTSSSSIAAPTSGPKPGGTLRLGAEGAAPTPLDPQVISPGNDRVSYLAWNQLTARQPDFSLQNLLAEEWIPNKTATEWTIRLRKGVEFHNGKTMTADDVIYSLKRIMNPKTGAGGSSQLKAVNEAGITKLDAYTVRLPMNQPTSVLPDLSADAQINVVPVGFDPKTPIGTGPYRVVKHVPGQSTQLTRFESYWGPKPYLDNINLTYVADDTARANALMSGQFDAITILAPQLVVQVKGQSNLRVLTGPSAQFNCFQLPVNTGPFQDVRVRQALRLATDRQQLVSLGAGGFAVPAYDVYGKGDPDFAASLTRELDVAQAKSLLKQAGHSDLAFQVTVAPQSPGAVAQAQVWAQGLAAAGVKATVHQVDVGTFYGRPQWPCDETWWPGLSIMSLAYQGDTYTAYFNRTKFHDPQYESAFVSALKTIDPTQRKQHEQTMQQILFERGSWVIPAFINNLAASTTKVAGIDANDLTNDNFMCRGLTQAYFV